MLHGLMSSYHMIGLALQELAKAVTTKLRDTVDRLLVPPWPSAAVAVSSIATAVRARRFGRAVRLLANIAAFDGALPAATLAELALRDVVQQQVRLASAVSVAES